jgi:hypothetical protein
MGSAGTAQRVKRGFHRIGLLGLIPGVIGAVFVLGYQYLQPSGGYQVAHGGTSIELESGSEWSVLPWASTKPGGQEYLESEKAKLTVEKAMKASGTTLRLLDGRELWVWPTPEGSQWEMSVNRSLVSYEVRRVSPVGEYEGPYLVGSLWVHCKSYSGCDAPFPVARQAHIVRKSEYGLALIPLALGFVWFVLTWVVSWIIRGFMSD